MEAVLRFQRAELSRLLHEAVSVVPYYRERNRSVSNERTAEETLLTWPILTKDNVRKAGSGLLALNHPKGGRLIRSTSGGSTGMPLPCFHDKESLREIYACHWALQRPGVKREDRYATFQGLEIVSPTQRHPPYWRMNWAMNQRIYSIFHLSKKTITDYLSDLDAYQPAYLAGYANSLYILGCLIEESGLSIRHSPRAIFSTSETLSDSQRALMKRVFKCRIWDAYSQDESCGSITEYECGYYHYDRSYGWMEFVDVEDLGGGRRLAEIICTGFLNRIWPLIRYSPGDLVEYEDAETCPGCGRPGPLIHGIRGRTGDYLMLPSGRCFPHISLIVSRLGGVRQVQLAQTGSSEVEIRYVPNQDFNESIHLPLMVKAFQDAVGESMRWQTREVVELARTSGGKFRSIVRETS
jgi:phenylacetate-CoA ligase